MPRNRTKAKPAHNHPELVEELAKEMEEKGVSPTPAVPTVYEVEQKYTNTLHVTVVWSKWEQVPVEERGAIILDAYEKAGLKEDMRRIAIALGVTPDEAKKLGRP